MPAAISLPLDVFQARQWEGAAAAASAILTAGLAILLLSGRGNRLLWIAVALGLAVSLGAFHAWRSKPRKVLRVTPEGFWVYRRWERVHGQPLRRFDDQGAFFPWRSFESVKLDWRTASFAENTKEQVLILVPSQPAHIDRNWSQDPDAPGFLVQASEQSVPAGTLLACFEHGLGSK